MKPVIIHISADYPDACQPRKTRAIAALVEGTADRFEHRVYSLNRAGAGLRPLFAPGSVTAAADDGQIASWRYAAPAGGLMLARSMRAVVADIVADIRARGLRPALVQGHKLSFEGIAAQRVAETLALPYALTLQGNTDRKVVGARPDLRPLYRRVWRDADAVFAFAPWIARWCESVLGPREQAPVNLPCIPGADAVIAPAPAGPRIVTAFHLDHWRNKNIAALAQACGRLRAAYPRLTLEIAGSGSTQSERAVDRALTAAGISDIARRIGPVAPDAIQRWMNGAAAMALPSRRETFGMVFIEALLAGCPILYPKGAAVDGYFDGKSFALGADAASVGAIAAALDQLLRHNEIRKRDLARWQGHASAPFRKGAILDSYARAIAGVIR